MIEVVNVRFKRKGKVYFFDPGQYTINNGEPVIVETSKGIEYAECTVGNHMVDDNAVVLPLRPVIRPATPEDTKRAEENREKEKSAFDVCDAKIQKHALDMKLVDVEYSFDGSKLLFFFTSDGRVDFRELVKDLAAEFKTRIELRQIGVRDEARLLGGLGICGRPFCCAQFLDDFQPVSIKMAKVQGLSLNPTKISGTCGRLMCCLKYEQDAYESLVKTVPKVDSFVNTPKGLGMVVDVNLLRGNVRVRLENQQDAAVCTFNANEVLVLGGKAKRAEYLSAKAEGIEVDETPYTPPKVECDDCPGCASCESAPVTYTEEEVIEEAAVSEPKPEQKKNSNKKKKHKKPAPKPNDEPKEKEPAPEMKAQASEQKSEKPKSQKPHKKHKKPAPKPQKAENGAPVQERKPKQPAEQQGEKAQPAKKPSNKHKYYKRKKPGNKPQSGGENKQ